MAIDRTARSVGWHYREARLRIDSLLRPLADDLWERPTFACPGWRVRDVLAHLVGNTEDAAAGRLNGIPTEELTAAQVSRHRDDHPLDLLDQWAAAGPLIEEAISGPPRWPAAVDVLTHEHDIRSALGDRGARENESVSTVAAMLAVGLDSPVPLSIQLDGHQIDDSPTDDSGARLTLRTTAFEFFRLRLGRRSLRQVRELDWSGDPEPVVEDLFIFGPASESIVE
jgi:uncharacterized protein (TIGR03083 family)